MNLIETWALVAMVCGAFLFALGLAMIVGFATGRIELGIGVFFAVIGMLGYYGGVRASES